MKVKKMVNHNNCVAYFLLPDFMKVINNWNQPEYATIVDMRGFGQFLLFTPFAVTDNLRDKIHAIRECIGAELDQHPDITENDLVDITTLYAPITIKEYLERAASGRLHRYHACFLFFASAKQQESANA